MEPKSPTFPPALFGKVAESMPPLLKAIAKGTRSRGPTPLFTVTAFASAETVRGALNGLSKVNGDKDFFMICFTTSCCLSPLPISPFGSA